jgi:hypothetical protein
MLEWFVTIFIFIAVIAVTALLFGGWLIVLIVSAIGRLLMLPLRPRRETPMLAGELTTPRCGNAQCRAENPPVAAYCRRCGSPMRAAPVQQVPVRRVAMW